MKPFPLDPQDCITPFLQKVLDGEYALPRAMQVQGVKSILDLGANIGAFSYWARSTYPDARIHAYEPHPKNAAKYFENMHHCGIENFSINQAAVTTKKEFALYESPINSGMHSYQKAMTGGAQVKLDVPVVHPDALPACDFLKVDTEGCELEILARYLETHETPTLISYEYHSEADRHLLEDLVRPDYMLVTGHAFWFNLGVCNLILRSQVQLVY